MNTMGDIRGSNVYYFVVIIFVCFFPLHVIPMLNESNCDIRPLFLNLINKLFLYHRINDYFIPAPDFNGKIITSISSKNHSGMTQSKLYLGLRFYDCLVN